MSNQTPIEQMVRADRSERVFIGQQSFKLFLGYYFVDWLQYEFAEFHEDFIEDIENLMSGQLSEVAWIAFRESAKTTFAKIAVIWAICYEKKHYINWDSYDKENAEAALFDIIRELQHNDRLIQDFGSLYTEARSQGQTQMKRVTAFITANGIKVEAFSTQQSTRGRVFGAFRPDMHVVDDFETVKTRDSMPITNKVIGFIEEMRSGLSSDSSVLYLANYISESGSVEHVRKNIKRNNRDSVERFVSVENGTWQVPGEPTWPGKYVVYDRDIVDGKLSLESKRRELGEQSYKENMLNQPAALGAPIFNRDKVDEELRISKKPVEVKGNFRVWKRFNPSHRYGIGADTSMGVGRDAQASVAIDFSCVPAEQVGSFDDNHMAPDIFAHELYRESEIFGGCIIAPESNAQSGGACLNELLKLTKNVYRIRRNEKTRNIVGDKYGWETHRGNQAEIIFQVRSAWEDGRLKINDQKILTEMRSYTGGDLTMDDKDTTRHFDLLRALGIAWAMKDYAIPPKRPAYQQRPFESSMPVDEPVEVRQSKRIRDGYQQPGFEGSGYE